MFLKEMIEKYEDLYLIERLVIAAGAQMHTIAANLIKLS